MAVAVAGGVSLALYVSPPKRHSMQTFPAGAPAHAGGSAAVRDVLMGTVLHWAALVVVGAGYPVGTPPSVGGTPASTTMTPLLEPIPPEELPSGPPDELLALAVGSKQTPFWQIAVPLLWQSLSLEQSCC
jgi:hypothetical protein